MPSLYLLVFGSGAILMALEVLGSRVMAPHFGSSVYVWGSLISIILTALAIGSYLGGLLADARPRRTTLAVILAIAGGLTAFIPVYGDSLAGALSSWDPRAGSLAAASLIFLLPTLFMGMVTPVAMRLGIADMAQLGKASGRLSAVSTAGSIIGTLGTTFFLIPLAGTKSLITWLAAGLFMLAAVALFTDRKRAFGVVTAALGIVLVLVGPTSRIVQGFEGSPFGLLRTVYQAESAYHNIRVMDGGNRRFLRFDESWQTGMVIDDPFESVFRYPDYFHLAMAQNPGIRDVLVIGLGGGAAPKRFWQAYPEVRIDAVEIDPKVVEVARAYFGVREDERLHLAVGDGRRFVETAGKRYDLIIIDAYHASAVPFHLTTREFMGSLREHLNPGGVVAFNVIGALEGEGSDFFRAFYKTVGERFPTSLVIPVSWQVDSSATLRRNIILLATDGVFEAASFKAAATELGTRIGMDLGRFAGDLYGGTVQVDDLAVLTDDHAPVDNLIHVLD